MNVVNGGSGTPGPLVSIPGVYTGVSNAAKSSPLKGGRRVGTNVTWARDLNTLVRAGYPDQHLRLARGLPWVHGP